MSKLPYKIQIVQDELNKLSALKNFEQTQRVVLSVIKLLDDSISENDLNLFQLFNDSDGKIRANATWFFEDQVMADRKATYKVHSENKLNIDFKVYGVNKASKRVVAWATALTPNFEDEPFNSKFSVGIDFIIPKSTDRVIIVLTNNYVIRTLELKGNLTVTFQEILSKWSEIKEYSNKTAVHNVLWESFDLQPLNKKFYAGISERFITLRQHLLKENILDEKHSSMFANRLLGRVIFTWFVDKKGIINPDLKYFDSYSFEDDSEYYRTKLERLFFGVLNTPTDEREYKDDVTPFLNGGLFEARQNDLYKNTKLTFPKNYFDELFKFLSEYNFTTDESTSQFQQVAIDPEMLGRIFENLLAEITEETGEQARKAKGAFYTPREIVDYMCKESLREYLKTKLPEDTYRDQRLYQLIDAPDKDFQDQDHNWRRDWKPYKDTIISALDDLKVLDPACGSGAFPIGMLQLLVRVYERLEPRFDSYKAKLQIIEKNIYGVDIEPMAVEIARLRTWLSIIVDEESDSKKIKPLPNLEFKFVCANSLIDLDKSGAASFWEDTELENKLQVLRDSYFNTESLNKKKKLRVDYDELVNVGENLFGESEKAKQLKTYRPFDNESCASFFDSEFMFGVKFFGLVIGNPPYVQLQKNGGYLADLFKNLNYETFVRTGDIYVLFYERGLKLITPETGLLCFITSSKWMRAGYGEKLRAFFAQRNPLILLDLGGGIFESATVDSNILLIQNAKNAGKTNTLVVKNNKDDLRIQVNNEAIIGSFKSSSTWFIGSSSHQQLKNKIESAGKILKDWDVQINRGLLTGLNEAFIIDENTKKRLIDEDSKNKEIIKPILRGRDIKRYFSKTEQYIIATHNGIKKDGLERVMIEEYPAIKKYLDGFEPKLSMRQDQGDTQYNLRNCAYINEFYKEKIVWKALSTEPSFCYTADGIFTNDKANLLTSNSANLKYLCGFLNSSLFQFLFSSIGVNMGDGYEYKVQFLNKISVPEVTSQNSSIVNNIANLVTEVLEAKKNGDNTNETESQINDLVMSLYNLTDEEKEIIKML